MPAEVQGGLAVKYAEDCDSLMNAEGGSEDGGFALWGMAVSPTAVWSSAKGELVGAIGGVWNGW